MKKGEIRFRGGFTFVEVSLVMAIGGLIFLMVFVALPSVQRLQRDSERQENLVTLTAAIKKFQTNNRGALPQGTGTVNYNASASGGTWEGFYREYLGANFGDPDGPKANYVLAVSTCGATATGAECTGGGVNNMEAKTFPNDNTIYILTGATCDGATAKATNNPRNVAAVYKLEGAGAACRNT